MACTNKDVNEKIGRKFMEDSQSFLKRYQKLHEDATDKSSRCKLLIDIRFAIECALKALIFFESDDNEKTTYKRVKNMGHKLESLFNDSIVKNHHEVFAYYNDIHDLKLDEYDVGLRYSLETDIKFNSDEKREEYYNMVNNLLNNGKIFGVANELYEVISKLHPIPFVPQQMSNLDIRKVVDIHNRISNLSS